MSVLIKGMKMPKSCLLCPFGDEFGKCCVNAELEDANELTHSCPLIELPDHGDLIDRDKLKHGFCVECTLYPDNCLGENCDWGSIYHIEHAHAVIPAERSEE